MTRLSKSLLFLLLLCASLPAVASAKEGAPLREAISAPLPNFIFIVTDDAGYDDFGFTGCTDWKTPRIDSIAEGGVTFTDGYVTASVCGPSRAGLITGRYQQSFGHEENLTGGLAAPVPAEKFGLPLDVPTLGTLLQKNGYATAAFGKWHLGEHEHFHPNRRGFDHFVGFLGGHRSFWPLEGKAHPGHRLMVNGEISRSPEYLTDHLGKEAAAFIKRHSGEPFFLYLAYNAVHSPLQARDEDLATLAHLSDKKRQVLGAMTVALDRSVGYVLDALGAHDLEKSTVVVLTNDNGAATYIKTNNGGFRGRKGTVWEGGLRVPFALRWPGTVAPGTRSSVPVNTLDVGYTFCQLAGYSDAELKSLHLDGGNLLALAKGEDPGRVLFWRRGNTAAARAGAWKLITTNNKPAFLFDLSADPMESANLLQTNSARTKTLFAALQSWDNSLPDPLWRKKASDSYDETLLRYWPQP